MSTTDEYPQTIKITIDDWGIIPDGMMKGIYHNCGADMGISWNRKAIVRIESSLGVCPNCSKPLPKDVDAIVSTMGIK